MDTEAWKTLITAVPWGVVYIIIHWMDLQDDKEQRKERDTNAAAKTQADRETNLLMAKTYAEAINGMAKVLETSLNNMSDVVRDFKETVIKQYESMGITQDLRDRLLEMAEEKTNLSKKGKGD